MPNNENLKSQEKIHSIPELSRSDASVLTAKNALTIFIERKRMIELIRPHVCLNFYHRLVDKVTQEEQRLIEILNLASQKKRILGKYSLVLDQQYFEQRFLTNRSSL